MAISYPISYNVQHHLDNYNFEFPSTGVLPLLATQKQKPEGDMASLIDQRMLFQGPYLDWLQ